MSSDSIHRLLSGAECGAYVVSLDQTILFWNEAAERILGHPPEAVVGRRCYEVMQGVAPGGLSPACLYGCPSVRALRAGRVPQSATMHLLANSGDRIEVSVTPMVVVDKDNQAPVLVHLFDPVSPQSQPRTPEPMRTDFTNSGIDIVSDRPPSPALTVRRARLTPRELEILRLVSTGWGTMRIAENLSISPHTVRNHVRNLRHKLRAKTKLDAVLTAMRQGLI